MMPDTIAWTRPAALRRIAAALMAALLLPVLCACRVRTSVLPAPEDRAAESELAAEAAPPAGLQDEDAEVAEEQELSEESPSPTESEDPEAPSENDESSDRREFASDASGEIAPDAETRIYAPPAEASGGEEPGAPEPEDGQASGIPDDPDGGGAAVNAFEDGAELTATETVAADEADKLGVDESGETADSIQTYYLTLLDSRLGALFECKRLNVYWETADDHVTVFRTSPEHSMITGAGAYDVSAKLLEENLEIDDGWVVRKDPDVIVKVMSGSSLDTVSADALCSELVRRDGWQQIGAVKERRVIILSQRLLETNAGRTAAMVYLAKLMYPDQTEDVDPDEALMALTEEAAGKAYAGVYAYML